MYALLPFALMMLQGFWNWFRKNVLGQDDDKIPENVCARYSTNNCLDAVKSFLADRCNAFFVF